MQFVTEDDCVKYLLQIRWPDGLVCTFCHAKADAWISEHYKLKCPKCRKVHSVLSWTVFQGTPYSTSHLVQNYVAHLPPKERI